MSKKMVSWRLDPATIKKLEDDAKTMDLNVTELVELKLNAPTATQEILKTVRRIERELKTWSHD